MHWHGWWHLGWMWIFWIILLVLALLVFFGLARSWRSQRAPQEKAERILRERYARGEIDQSEYERKLRALRR